MDQSLEIQEHMEVVGSDGEHVGTVDRLENERIKLTRSDPAAGGVHRYLGLDQVGEVKNGKVCLKVPGTKAREAMSQ